jgi:hypothetical protein
VHGFDFAHDAEVALAVAEVSQDAPDRVVNFGGILAEEARGTDALHVAPGIIGLESR